MKIKIKIAIIFSLVLTLLCTSLIGCTKKSTEAINDLATVDYKSFEVAPDLDSLELFKTGLEYLKTAETYRYIHRFDFTAGSFATQTTQDIVKKNKNILLHNQIIIGAGVGEEHYAHYRYFSDTKNQEVATPQYRNNKNKAEQKEAKARVPGKEGSLDFDLSNIAPKDMPDVEKKYNVASGYKITYNYDASFLAPEHSSKVYKKGNFYYCDITMNTINCVEDKTQPELIADIEEGTGGTIKKFRKNTVLKLKLEKVKNTFRLSATLMEEAYDGVLTITLKVDHLLQRIYSYDAKDAKFTDAELAFFK